MDPSGTTANKSRSLAETRAQQATVDEEPIAKLDAGDYRAEDLDGGIEGTVGSGNMSQSFLQAQQANEAVQNADPTRAGADSAEFSVLPQADGGGSNGSGADSPPGPDGTVSGGLGFVLDGPVDIENGASLLG